MATAPAQNTKPIRAPAAFVAQAGKGRPKGATNKFTADVKAMILGALDKAHPNGGEAYLADQAVKNPAAFLSLVGKVLPLQVGGVDGAPIQAQIRVSFVGKPTA